MFTVLIAKSSEVPPVGGDTVITSAADDGYGTFPSSSPDTACSSFDSSDDFLVGTDNTPSYRGFLRFTNVLIPQGSTITGATLTIDVTARAANFADGAMTYVCDDVDNAVAPTDTSDMTGLFTTGTYTTAFGYEYFTNIIIGSNDLVGESGMELYLPIQEVINRGSWASGNALTLLLWGTTGSPVSNRYITIDDYSGTVATLAITFT